MLGGTMRGGPWPSAQQPQHGQGSTLPADEGTTEHREDTPGNESCPAGTQAGAGGTKLTPSNMQPPEPHVWSLLQGLSFLCHIPLHHGWLKTPVGPPAHPLCPLGR